jgi:hypothetical protein
MYITAFLITLTWVLALNVTYHIFNQMTNRKLALLAGVATGIAVTFFFTTVLLLVLLLY